VFGRIFIFFFFSAYVCGGGVSPGATAPEVLVVAASLLGALSVGFVEAGGGGGGFFLSCFFLSRWKKNFFLSREIYWSMIRGIYVTLAFAIVNAGTSLLVQTCKLENR